MKVLSLFDGMSCGRIALTELGISIEQYLSSEIDKYAIKQTQLNFPDTVQLGDVTKWKEWAIDWKSINLLLAGSPCQGFSFAGKQLAFDDPRSKLFFVFIDILNHIRSLNPDVMFLLENVNMKRSHMRIISEYCGVFPVNINSNLVSAQNRDRWYWTNIRTKQVGLFGETYVDIPQPKDRKIFLRDVLESEVDEKYYVSPKCLAYITKDFRLAKGYTQIDSQDKSLSLMAKSNTNWNGDYVKESKDGRIKRDQNKASCLTGAGGHGAGNHSDMDLICVAMRGRNPDHPSDRRTGIHVEQRLEAKTDGETNCLTSVQKDNLILQRPRGYNQGALFEGKTPTLSSCAWEQNNLLCTKEVIQLNPSKVSGGIQPYQQDRIYDVNGISPALLADMSSGTHAIAADRIRRLTPTECSRLQTVPAWYHWGCSDTQIYRMLGNGWTVEVIKHILGYLHQHN